MFPNRRPADAEAALALLRAGQAAFRRAVALDAPETAGRLAQAYAGALKATERPLRELAQAAQTRGMTTSELARHSAVRALRAELRESLADLRRAMLDEARRGETNGIQAGARAGARLLQFGGLTAWNRPSLETIRQTVRIVDDPVFRERVEAFGPYHADAVADLLVTSAASGRGPEAAARTVRNYVRGADGLPGVPLQDAVRTARTVALYAARRSSHEMYRANQDVVEGWLWAASLDGKVCLSCIAKQGSRHELHEELNDHPWGRCSPIPITKRWQELGFGSGVEQLDSAISGETWFRGLAESEQRRRMGPSRWLAWRDGLFAFERLSAVRADALYGPMQVEASLEGLVGQAVARLYRRAA